MSLPVPRVHFVKVARSLDDDHRRGSAQGLLLGAILLGGIVATCVYVNSEAVEVSSPHRESNIRSTKGLSDNLFPIKINPGPEAPVVATGIINHDGVAVTVSCSTCHASRQPNFGNRSSSDLNEFHGEISLTHGNISCLSCHNENDYDTLKLADSTSINYKNVMTLCAQCHGPQAKDYEHGAHGGMQGYWDLSRGPRTKNNCVDCHSPHDPKFPKMKPTFKPRDRFLNSPDAGAPHE